MRVLGIDPGTRSFDLCGLDDGEVYYEEVLDVPAVAKNPELLIKATERAMPLDLIAGPSGYGVEITPIERIARDVFRDWYYNYILLTTREEIEGAVSRNVFGALVYHAMVESSLEMHKRNWPVVYIPGVIHLPTVPSHRKINKMDMGTADKMCVTVLGVYDQSRHLGIPCENASFILVEMGFGYNSVMGVDGGRIVDGIGGTTISGLGFLTAACMDLELVQFVSTWEKADVFTGGIVSITGKSDPESFVLDINKNEKCMLGWNTMMESIEKAVASLSVSVPQPKEILISGRLTRIDKVKDELTMRLSRYAQVRELGYLKGAKLVKETAQGYAMVADGLASGKFKDLIEWMRIRDAKGTALDHISHPKFESVRKKLVPFK